MSAQSAVEVIEAPIRDTKVDRSSKGITIGMLKTALRNNAGIYAMTARELGCTRSSVKNRVDGSPELTAYRAEIQEEIDDCAEGTIYESILDKDKEMVRWYAPRKMRARGYGNQAAMTGADGGAIQVNTSIAVTVEYVNAPALAIEEE